MANKYCSKCGAELPEDAKFCVKCGHPTTYLIPKKKKSGFRKISNKSLFFFIAVIGVLFLIILGSIFFTNYSENRKETQSRQKKEMLIPMEEVLAMYKTNTRSYVISKIEEYGYQYFGEDEYSEYYSKDVELKMVEDWRGDIHYEPVQRTGSKVYLSKSSSSFNFGITVFSKEDFVEWEEQLKDLGYKEESYGENLPMEGSWTALGAHGNLCKLYSDGNGNSIEFMKDGDGHPGYDVYTVEFSK